MRWLGVERRRDDGTNLTCLGASVLSAAMSALVLIAFSCCRFHPFGEIRICLISVLFVRLSLPALHIVCVALVGSLTRLRFLQFRDALALFY